MDDGAGAEGVSFRGLANSMDGSEGFLEPLVCGEGSAMLLLAYQIQIISNNEIIFNNYVKSMLCGRDIIKLYSTLLTLDGGGATCIGWDGKMLRVGGGLIPPPDDDEFSAETHTYKQFITINYIFIYV